MAELVFLLVMLVVAILLLVVITSAFIGFLMTRVPFVPTHAGDVEFIVRELGIQEKHVFYDLGSGDGKVVFLVNELSGASCVGFELTWWTHALAVVKSAVFNKKSKMKFKNQDFFRHSWVEASHVYGYLYPPLMRMVEEKFLADCQPGSVAIIRDFPFPNLKPSKVYYMPKEHEIYIYKKV